MVIPPVEPDLLSWTKRRAYRTAGVWWRGRENVLLMDARLLGARLCGSGIICWGWRREQGEQRPFVLADGLAQVIGQDMLRIMYPQRVPLSDELTPCGTQV